MLSRKDVSDKDLLKAVTQRLNRAGGSDTHVTAMVRQGTVTLTGKLHFAYQRDPIIKAIGRVTGVRTVIDQLLLVPKRAM